MLRRKFFSHPHSRLLIVSSIAAESTGDNLNHRLKEYYDEYLVQFPCINNPFCLWRAYEFLMTSTVFPPRSIHDQKKFHSRCLDKLVKGFFRRVVISFLSAHKVFSVNMKFSRKILVDPISNNGNWTRVKKRVFWQTSKSWIDARRCFW